MSDSGRAPGGGSSGLGRRAARGAAWMFGLNMTNRVMGLVRTAIVARLLGPGQLGVFGAAMLFMSMLETATQTGLRSALIRKQDDVESYLDTAWVWMATRGMLVAALMTLGAPAIAQFFRQPQLVLLIRLIAITEILGGFVNIGIVQFNRRLQFRQVYLLEAVPTVVDVTISVVAAFVLRSALALVIGYVARYFVWLAMSFIVHPFRPRFRFDRRKAAELFRYGRWVTGSSWLNFAYGNGDDILVGRVLGTTSLGLYQVAYKYSNLPTTEITRVVQSVALPAYARLYGDEERFRKGFLDVLTVTTLTSVTLAGVIWVLAGDLTWLILGPKWLAVIPLLRLLAAWGASESISEASNAVFQAAGKPHLCTQVIVVKTIILAVLIWPFTMTWGLYGTCVAVVVSSIPALLLSLWRARSTVRTSALVLARTVGAPVLAGVAAGLGGWAIAGVLPEQSLMSLLVRSLLVVAVYVVAALLSRLIGYEGVPRLLTAARAALTREAA